MGCGDSQELGADIVLDKPSGPIDNTPYEGMEKIVNKKAWEKFAEYHHQALNGQGDWTEDDKELKDLTKIENLKSGDQYLGQVNTKGKLPDGFGVIAYKTT